MTNADTLAAMLLLIVVFMIVGFFAYCSITGLMAVAGITALQAALIYVSAVIVNWVLIIAIKGLTE